MALIEAPLRTLPPVNFAYKLTYARAGGTPNKFLPAVFGAGMAFQTAFPATAAVYEQMVNSRSTLHEAADKPGPHLLAGLIDLAGWGIAALALESHMPQLHLQVPITHWEIPTAVTAIAEAKLGVNLATNLLWGVGEDVAAFRIRRAHNRF